MATPTSVCSSTLNESSESLAYQVDRRASVLGRIDTPPPATVGGTSDRSYMTAAEPTPAAVAGAAATGSTSTINTTATASSIATTASAASAGGGGCCRRRLLTKTEKRARQRRMRHSRSYMWQHIRHELNQGAQPRLYTVVLDAVEANKTRVNQQQ